MLDQDFPGFHWVIFVSIWLLMAITFSASFVGDFSGGLEWAIEKLKVGPYTAGDDVDYEAPGGTFTYTVKSVRVYE